MTSENKIRKVPYPAHLILSRFNPTYNPPALVIVDPKVIQSDEDLSEVLAYYNAVENIPGAVTYDKRLVPAAQVDAMVAACYAEMERQVAACYAEMERQAAPAELPRPSALDRAYLAARSAFKGDKKGLERLREALPIVRGGQVEDLGGGNFRVMSYGQAYTVNGTCSCPEFGLATQWCTHRLAVALFCRAARLEAEDAAG